MYKLPQSTAMQQLKKYGIGKKLLDAFVAVVRNNPDPLCITDKIFLRDHRVSPQLARYVNHKDFVKVFGALGIYNLVHLPGASENYDFVAKLSNGNIHRTSTPRRTKAGTYVNFTEAVSKVLLKTILFIKDNGNQSPAVNNTDDLVYEESEMTQPTNSSSQFMTFDQMPPGLAEAILASGIKPMTKEQWESINVPVTNHQPLNYSDTDINVVTDVVDKTTKTSIWPVTEATQS